MPWLCMNAMIFCTCQVQLHVTAVAMCEHQSPAFVSIFQPHFQHFTLGMFCCLRQLPFRVHPFPHPLPPFPRFMGACC